MKKKTFFLYLLNEKTEFILLSEIKCPKSGIFTNNSWVQVSIGLAVFSGAVEKFLGQRWLSPLEKNWPVRLYDTTYVGILLGWVVWSGIDVWWSLCNICVDSVSWPAPLSPWQQQQQQRRSIVSLMNCDDRSAVSSLPTRGQVAPSRAFLDRDYDCASILGIISASRKCFKFT